MGPAGASLADSAQPRCIELELRDVSLLFIRRDQNENEL